MEVILTQPVAISGADKWPINECSVQIFNKDFFGPIFFALRPQYRSVGGTRPDFLP